jgi:hypothetical protein
MIENVQTVLLAVLEFIRVELKNRIVLFIERAVQALKDQPYTSFSARQQSRAAERWLAEGRAQLEKGLHQRLVDAFTRPAARKDVSYEELKLLDDESLNVVMLRARLVSSVMERAREQVVALEVRLEALNQAGARINSKAFSPSAIADGFMETLKALDVPPEVQIVLMEAYSERGSDLLMDFYRDLNELLIKRGVVPDFKYADATKGAPGKGRTGAGTGGGPGGGPGGGAWTGHPGATLPPGMTPPAGAEPPPAWPTAPAGTAMSAQFAQLVDAKLTVMQQALVHLTAENWQPGTLRDTFKLPPPISLSPEQEESIDHIEAVFLDLIRDTRISPRFRSEFNRLILPMMSLRLTDVDLFKDPENPVRRFIRQLALLGFRDKEIPIEEFEHISLVVGRIVSERAQELSSFSTGADALYTIARNEVSRQLEARQKVRKPAAPAEEPSGVPEQTAMEAHRFTQATLRAMSAGLHLPTVIQHFVLRLLAPWMMRAYLEHGEASDEVRDCILFASTFFDLLEPATSDDKHQLNIQLRRQSLEQMAFEALKSRTKSEEVVMLLEGVAGFFEELNANPEAGLARSKDAQDEAFVSYLDDLPVIRAQK